MFTVFTKHSLLPAYCYTCMLYMLKVLRATSLLLALPLLDGAWRWNSSHHAAYPPARG